MVLARVSDLGWPAAALFHAGGPVEGGYDVMKVRDCGGRRGPVGMFAAMSLARQEGVVTVVDR